MSIGYSFHIDRRQTLRSKEAFMCLVIPELPDILANNIASYRSFLNIIPANFFYRVCALPVNPIQKTATF
ncbi:MAG: hypothetical protein ACFFKA_20900 [Candidatus Thorarchaeota archaeon]